MLSKNLIKQISALALKKNRQREGLFVAEGPKVVGDLMKVSRPLKVIALAGWIAANRAEIAEAEIHEVTEDELRRVSFLQHPQQVLAVFPIPRDTFHASSLTTGLHLALDNVQDPGNLGTIIRIADWFGIRNVICNLNTADVFNPKVIQATMGSISHVNVAYVDLPEVLSQLPESVSRYGTFLDGEDIYSQQLTSDGVIVMGNEGNGISPEVAEHITHRLLIPNYSLSSATAESLNVAIATAITCAEFRRAERKG